MKDAQNSINLPQLGNYQLVRWLGRGGFADVYLGKHVFLDTWAAIKVLHVAFARSDEKAFLNEARISAHLRHPHIVQVLDFGFENHIPFLVMAYAPNGTLRHLHPPGSRLALPTIISYVDQLASAVQYIHDKGYIHRDIKPENVLMGVSNTLLLSDFSISVAVRIGMSQQQTHIGTVSYMAPELLQPQAEPCLASDQYALGIMVYEWLYGRLPFRGGIDDIILQHLTALPPSYCTEMPQIPRAVESVVFKALEKNPTQRFESITAFSWALQAAAGNNALNLSSGEVLWPELPIDADLPVSAAVSSLPQNRAVHWRSRYQGRQEITFCYSVTLLLVFFLVCILGLLKVDALLLQLALSLYAVAFPLVWALVKKNKLLFFLSWSFVTVAFVLAWMSSLLLMFLVAYIILLFVCLLITFAVSLSYK